VRALLGLASLDGPDPAARLTEPGRTWRMEDNPCAGPGYDLTFQPDGKLRVRRFEGCDDSSSEESFAGKWTQGAGGIKVQLRKIEDLHGRTVEFGSCEEACWEGPCEQKTPATACFALVVRGAGDPQRYFEGPFRPRGR